jgi:hypothetical protein
MPDTPPTPDSDPQIQQDVKGDRNQVIGQVIGGMVVYVIGGQAIINPPVDKATSLPKSISSEIGPNPYKGLLAFHETDGDRFFGRDPQIKELWEKFRNLHEDESATRLLTIYGPSGSGKSSLARAGFIGKYSLAREREGLIPELYVRPLPGLERARVAVMVPGSHPLDALATVLARIATGDATPVAKTREFATELKEVNSEGGYDGLRRIGDALPEIADKPLLVLVDQLEEVFTLCEDSAERDVFIGNLICAAADRSKRVSAIVTLRSDFLGATQKYPRLNQLIASQGYFVAAMDEKSLRKAIAEPAKKAGNPIDQITVNRMIKETKGREGALPLLQFALEKIWEELGKGKEPAETLENIGGVGGALAKGAKRIYKKLTSEEKEISRRVFTGLVQLGEGSKDTRRRTELERIVSHRDSLEQVQRVIARFSAPGARLITLAEDGGKKTVEVTHEALFDHWQQMKVWLDGSRHDLRFQRRLDEAAMVWQEHGRQEGSLWRSPDLDLLRKHHKERGDDMTALQIEFMNASEKSATRRKRMEALFIYFMLGIFSFFCVGVFYLITHTDFGYFWAKKQNEYTFFIPTLKSKNDKRNNYFYDLLLLVLMEAYPEQKNKIEIKTREFNKSQGSFTEALNRGELETTSRKDQIKLDIVWTMQTSDRNSLARKVLVGGQDFSATFGLLSHRLCLINSKSKINDTDISTIKEQKSFIEKVRVTQVGNWPDSDFLRSYMINGLNETESYEDSKKQLLDPKNRVNCFLRGVSEIYIEEQKFKKEYNFSVANNFFYQYYSLDVIYVAKENKKLAKAIEQGIEKSLKSGKLLCVYKNHYSDFIQKAKLTKAKKISLDGLNIKRSKYYLDFTKDYKDISKDIESMGDKRMPEKDCQNLVDDLKKRNKSLNE